MTRLLLPFALAVLLAAPTAAQDNPPPAESRVGSEAGAEAEQPAEILSLEHRMLLRCSAAFALVAHGQATGDEASLAHPPLEQRGREFFVQASARVMDEAGLERDAIVAALTAEALELSGTEMLDQVMPACLATLQSTGL